MRALPVCPLILLVSRGASWHILALDRAELRREPHGVTCASPARTVMIGPKQEREDRLLRRAEGDEIQRSGGDQVDRSEPEDSLVAKVPWNRRKGPASLGPRAVPFRVV